MRKQVEGRCKKDGERKEMTFYLKTKLGKFHKSPVQKIA